MTTNGRKLMERDGVSLWFETVTAETMREWLAQTAEYERLTNTSVNRLVDDTHVDRLREVFDEGATDFNWWEEPYHLGVAEVEGRTFVLVLGGRQRGSAQVLEDAEVDNLVVRGLAKERVRDLDQIRKVRTTADMFVIRLNERQFVRRYAAALDQVYRLTLSTWTRTARPSMALREEMWPEWAEHVKWAVAALRERPVVENAEKQDLDRYCRGYLVGPLAFCHAFAPEVVARTVAELVGVADAAHPETERLRLLLESGKVARRKLGLNELPPMVVEHVRRRALNLYDLPKVKVWETTGTDWARARYDARRFAALVGFRVARVAERDPLRLARALQNGLQVPADLLALRERFARLPEDRARAAVAAYLEATPKTETAPA